MPIPKIVGKNIDFACVLLGWSQSDLGVVIGAFENRTFSVNAVSLWMNAPEKNLTLVRLVQIVFALSCAHDIIRTINQRVPDEWRDSQEPYLKGTILRLMRQPGVADGFVDIQNSMRAERQQLTWNRVRQALWTVMGKTINPALLRKSGMAFPRISTYREREKDAKKGRQATAT